MNGPCEANNYKIEIMTTRAKMNVCIYKVPAVASII